MMSLWRLGGLSLGQGGLNEKGLELDEIGSVRLWKPCFMPLMPVWKQMEPKLRNQIRQFGFTYKKKVLNIKLNKRVITYQYFFFFFFFERDHLSVIQC